MKSVLLPNRDSCTHTQQISMDETQTETQILHKHMAMCAPDSFVWNKWIRNWILNNDLSCKM